MGHEIIRQFHQYCEDIARFCAVDFRIINIDKKEIIDTICAAQDFCDVCDYQKCRAGSTHSYGCYEAYRLNDYYLFYCPLGLSFVAASICDEYGILKGGITAGPFVVGDSEELMDLIVERAKSINANSLPSLLEEQGDALGRLMEIACSETKRDIHSNEINKRREDTLDFPREKQRGSYATPTIPVEQRLYNLICAHDSSGAREIMNQIISKIRRESHGNFDIIKQKMTEICVVIVQAAGQTGANTEEIFGRQDYINEIQKFNSSDQLINWVFNALRRFLDYRFEFTEVKHSNIIFTIKHFISSHYYQKLTLDDISRQVHLTPGYISSLFREETGETIVTFINRTRVEQSKKMLLSGNSTLMEIAYSCGFEDQNYYARVFKRITGVSPSIFRKAKGRI